MYWGVVLRGGQRVLVSTPPPRMSTPLVLYAIRAGAVLLGISRDQEEVSRDISNFTNFRG